MPNIAAPELAAHLERCWELYRHGELAQVGDQLDSGRRLLERALPTLDQRSRGNAEIELAMLGVVAGMLTAEGSDKAYRTAMTVADGALDPAAPCDALHRLGAFAVGVHAGMRTGRLRAAELRFRQALAIAQGLTADGGEPGVSSQDVCAVLGCGGLHLAGAAAALGEADMAFALLDHSVITARELGREHDVLGQYFGPQHVVAMRSICLATLGRLDDAIAAGRQVDTAALMPLVAATLLRVLAECCERLERSGEAAVLRARGDAISPPPDGGTPREPAPGD